jgi:hypothetical protein
MASALNILESPPPEYSSRRNKIKPKAPAIDFLC